MQKLLVIALVASTSALNVATPLVKPALKQSSASKALELRGGAMPNMDKMNPKVLVCATGFLGALGAIREVKEGGMISFDLAKKIFTVIYTIFFAQFLAVPTFFFNDNFVSPADATNQYVIFFMRLFGWCGLTALYLLFPNVDAASALKYMAIANAGFCWFGPISAELTHDVTPKHIVPIVLLPICSAVTLLATM
jgi:hypothetical protein